MARLSQHFTVSRVLISSPAGLEKVKSNQTHTNYLFLCTFIFCRIIRDLFNHARCIAGQSVIFIDEVDCICRRRTSEEEEHTRRIKTELLHQMEGANTNCHDEDVFLLCATNCPWELDPAFLRRFQRRIYISLPCRYGNCSCLLNTGFSHVVCRAARLQILQHQLQSTSACLSESDWHKLADCTEGYSGSDLANVTADALLQPVREMEQARYWKPLSSQQVVHDLTR